MELRDYQLDAVTALFSAYDQGAESAMVAMPTGAGKTAVACEMVKQMCGRTLFFAHRNDLVDQAAAALAEYLPGVPIGVVQADRNEIDAPVIVASIPTLLDPVRRASIGSFDMTVTDEVHHVAAPSFQEVVEGVPASFRVGITASPLRADAIWVPRVFGQLAYLLPTIDLIERGVLCDLSDFCMDWPRCTENTVALATEIAGTQGIPTAVFTDTVHEAGLVANACFAAGIPSWWVSGDTPRLERQRVYNQVRNGEIRVIVHAGVLTEGVDIPELGAAIIARRMRSNVMMGQAVGRILRRSPGKESAGVYRLVEPWEASTAPIAVDGFIGPAYQWLRDATYNQQSVRTAIFERYNCFAGAENRARDRQALAYWAEKGYRTQSELLQTAA